MSITTTGVKPTGQNQTANKKTDGNLTNEQLLETLGGLLNGTENNQENDQLTQYKSQLDQQLEQIKNKKSEYDNPAFADILKDFPKEAGSSIAHLMNSGFQSRLTADKNLYTRQSNILQTQDDALTKQIEAAEKKKGNSNDLLEKLTALVKNKDTETDTDTKNNKKLDQTA